MTKQEYQIYIRKQLLELAVKKYPDDAQKQMIYQLGFLQAQLAEAMYNDNHIANTFKHTVKR
jgi:hypothetical protein